MTLKRQLLLVSLLALMLPWAGCEFIRETESALRSSHQQMLAGNARVLANNMADFREEYPDRLSNPQPAEQLFLHVLRSEPRIDGYFEDWLTDPQALKSIRGSDGPIHIGLAKYGRMIYLFIDVRDRKVIYATAQSIRADNDTVHDDRVVLVSSNPPYLEERFSFAAEAPGAIISYKHSNGDFQPEAESTISAYWRDVRGGYHVEARIPADILGTHLGLIVSNTSDASVTATQSASFSGRSPSPVVTTAEDLQAEAENLVQPGMRILITNAAGWRIAEAGELSAATTEKSLSDSWSARIYDLLVEGGEEATSAEPDLSGREQRPYVSAALGGREMASWFRGEESGRAIVAVATPIIDDSEILGALIMQQGTDSILSLTNEGLVRLINLTLIATVLVAGVLLGYATWLSRRIRHLSLAAEEALENETLHAALPSALAEDEIGDLSRSFSYVLQQLGDYNAYLRSLASKLSHELRTPLAIVTSSLENLEHEPLSEASAGYTARARDGADRLRGILSAMSEASRVEGLMAHAEAEEFDLRAVLHSTSAAYRDAYKERRFDFECTLDTAVATGSPELLIQMLDKLVDNAVDFSSAGDTIAIGLESQNDSLLLSVTNPGPALPEQMRTQLFDSMVSMRGGEDSRHLGLGLYVAKLIVEGHGGDISANNVDGGVRFNVQLPAQVPR